MGLCRKSHSQAFPKRPPKPTQFSLQPELFILAHLAPHFLAFLNLLKSGLRNELSCSWRWLPAQGTSPPAPAPASPPWQLFTPVSSLGCSPLSPAPQPACLPFPPLPQPVASQCPSALPGRPDSDPTGEGRVVSPHGSRRLEGWF